MSADRANLAGLLRPGPAHPHPPTTAAGIAARFGVTPEAVGAWLDEGLSTTVDGIDPFAVANWLSWGRLDRCPVLARRWRTWLGLFLPFVRGADATRTLVVRRTLRLHLPHGVARLRWWPPLLLTTPGQRLDAVRAPLAWTGAEHTGVTTCDAVDGLATADDVGALPTLSERTVVTLTPQTGLPAGHPERRDLTALLVDLAGDFRYGYRHHPPGVQVAPDGRGSGSCLDCVLELGRRLSERGRAWRLRAGVVASTAVANPHFWLDAETTAGWFPLDPSLPAIARMLARSQPELDWRAIANAYVTGCDARRIVLGRQHAIADIPGGATLDSIPGEAVVEDGGQVLSAWPCMDWACGECDVEFSAARTHG